METEQALPPLCAFFITTETEAGCRFLTSVLYLWTFFSPCDRVSICSPGCPGTCSVDQAGLDLRDLPASASRVPGLQESTQLYLCMSTVSVLIA